MQFLEQQFLENRREQLAEQGIERAEGQDEDIETDEELLNKHAVDLFDVFKDSVLQFSNLNKNKTASKKAASKAVNTRKDQVRNFANESLFAGEIADADLEY